MIQIKSKESNNSHITENKSVSKKEIHSKRDLTVKFRSMAALAGKIAVGILIVPWFFSIYRKWVGRSITQLKTENLKEKEQNFHNTVKNTSKIAQNSSEVPWKKLSKYTHDPKLNLKDSARVEKTNENKIKYETSLKKKKNTHAAKKYPLMGRISWVPGEFGFWMPGVGLIASYLSQKHNVKGLFVCQTLEGFSEKLSETLQNSEDQRAAFVIPVFSSKYSKEEGFEPNFAQHKITVLVEKKAGKTNIMILDPGGTEKINPLNISSNIWEGWETPGSFSSDELALRAILKASPDSNTEIFYSTVPREAAYGCYIYALKDSVSFLQDPQFFEKLQGKEEAVLGKDYKLKSVSKLPAAFMIGSQRVTALNAYIFAANKEDLKIPGKDKTLTDYLSKNRVTVKGKEQNHYITRKNYKYSKLVLKILKKLSSEQIEGLLDETLIK